MLNVIENIIEKIKEIKLAIEEQEKEIEKIVENNKYYLVDKEVRQHFEIIIKIFNNFGYTTCNDPYVSIIRTVPYDNQIITLYDIIKYFSSLNWLEKKEKVNICIKLKDKIVKKEINLNLLLRSDIYRKYISSTDDNKDIIYPLNETENYSLSYTIKKRFIVDFQDCPEEKLDNVIKIINNEINADNINSIDIYDIYYSSILKNIFTI